jgi:ADP-heptose:LPS heptosyltransferase
MHSRLQLTLSQGHPESVLIVFPMDEPSFRVACYAFRDLRKKDGQKTKFIFLVKEQFKDLFYLQMGDTMFIQHSNQYTILSDEKLVLQALKEYKFDIIVDSNPEFHLGIARLISFLTSDMKVGFVSDFSDRFYNIQLNISKSGIMEKGFKQINWILAQ